jgi:CheY-like chemotaxis protein
VSAADSLAPVHVIPGPDEAVASVAHEMRLPLSHIKGFVSALRRSDVEWDSETRRDYLAEIELEADRLAEIVESLMDAASPAQLRPSPGIEGDLTPPATIVDGAIHRVRGLLGDRAVRRNLAADLPPVRVNAVRMERVLANLLQNAVKYTPVDTPIDVSARVTRDGELEVVVADRGPGVPRYTITRYSSHSSAVTMVMAQVCRATVWVWRSRSPSLWRMAVVCPLRIGQAVARRSASFFRCNNQRKRPMTTQQTILVVDDEAPMRKLLSGNLKASGYDVRAAEDGTEALKLIDEHPTDLLLLDVNLPGPSGLQVLEAIRRSVEIPILILSGRSRERDKVEALHLGADDYLTKPFGVAELLARVKALLRRGPGARAVPCRPTVIKAWRSTSRPDVHASMASMCPSPNVSSRCSPTLPATPARYSCIGRCCGRSGADSTVTNPTTFGPSCSGSAARSSRTDGSQCIC